MTTLRNTIHIAAPPERVFAVLARLDALHEYDPGVARSELQPGIPFGLGAARHCDLRGGGWFRERVIEFEPHRAIAFELRECTLPVKQLTHHYTLTPERGGTRVDHRKPA